MSQPPVVPGPSYADEPAPVAAEPPARKRRSLVVPVIVAGAVLTIALAGAAVWALTQDEVPLPGPLEQKTELTKAQEHCRTGDLDDDGYTLFLDLDGQLAGSGTVDVDRLQCVLRQLDTPSYVTTAMEQTRALDGRVSEKWGNFEATWTYHPDEGLNVLIREVG